MNWCNGIVDDDNSPASYVIQLGGVHCNSSCHFARRSLANQEDGKQLLDQIEFIHSQAKEAVTLGDGTIKEANNTYYTLAGK